LTVRADLAELERPALETALASFAKHGSAKLRADFATRYGIVTKDKTFGVPMAKLHLLAKQLGRDHALAQALWATGIYEARMLACFVEEPARVTPAQMDRWARAADNWAVTDTLCFKLFDQTPHAWAKAEAWCGKPQEFVKRAGLALIASLALHTKGGDAAPFLRALGLIERAATDERNFVKKGASWALRAIGQRKDPKTKAAALALAQRLAASPGKAAAFIGRDALKAIKKRSTPD
jgi:3-methyladenine DNA glycosylase AlkD